MLRIQITKKVKKTLDSLPKKHKAQIKDKLRHLLENPFSQQSKALKGKKYQSQHLLRAKSGEYRIIYTVNINQNILEVLLIAKRNDNEVYKRLHQLI